MGLVDDHQVEIERMLLEPSIDGLDGSDCDLGSFAGISRSDEAMLDAVAIEGSRGLGEELLTMNEDENL